MADDEKSPPERMKRVGATRFTARSGHGKALSGTPLFLIDKHEARSKQNKRRFVRNGKESLERERREYLKRGGVGGGGVKGRREETHLDCVNGCDKVLECPRDGFGNVWNAGLFVPKRALRRLRGAAVKVRVKPLSGPDDRDGDLAKPREGLVGVRGHERSGEADVLANEGATFRGAVDAGSVNCVRAYDLGAS